MFLQETHSSKVTEKKWNEEFNGDLLFSHGKTNSCSVLVGFYGNINYSVKKKLSENSGRILVLDVTIDCTEYLLINLYNGITEPEQLNILESLNLCDLWRIRKPKSKGFTFRKCHFAGSLQRRLDYLFQTICKNLLKMSKY